MTLSRMRKSHDESRSFSSMINVLGFLADGHTFLTKSGDVGVVVSYRGRDSECLEPLVKDGIVAGVRSALVAAFDESFTIKLYLRKTSDPELEASDSDNEVVREAIRNRNEYLRSKGAELFSFETYLVIICKGQWGSPKIAERLSYFIRHPRRALRESLRANGRALVLDETIEATKRHLLRAVGNFLEQTADSLSGRMLPKKEAFAFFRRLVNPCRHKAAAVGLSYDAHVDFFIVDSELECHRDHLRLDNHIVKTLTLKHPPSHTHADLLRALLRVAGDMTVVLEWNFLDSARGVSLIHSKRRHFHNTKSSMWSGVATERPLEREVLFDESKEALVSDLGRCLEQIELSGLRLGELSLTLVLTGENLDAVDQASAEVMKVFGTFEGALNEERYNGLNAFLATLPGGFPFNLRKLLATNENHADLGFWFLPSQGERTNAFLGAENLVAFETDDRSLFFYNLHVGDVGHALVVGPNGTGKSYLLNFLLTYAQKYRPVTIIFDVGGSYRLMTELHGGNYIQVRPDALPFSINPFCLPPTAKNLQFLHSFCKVLIEHGGFAMSDADDRDLFESIRSLYVLEPEQRRLLTLSTTVSRVLGTHLRRWTEGEQHGRWFDNIGDNVSYSRFQCIDFEGMDRLGVVLEPLLFYLLFRADEFIYDPALATTFKLFTADEAWRFFKHPVTRAYITEALRTWRKKNAAIILATQSAEDLTGADVLRPVVDNCPTKIIFGNPTLNAKVYGDLFGLTETEQERVRRLIPKKQFLLKREGLSKVLNLNVDPKSHWLFTTNPYEAQRRQKAIDERGSLRSALETLVGEIDK